VIGTDLEHPPHYSPRPASNGAYPGPEARVHATNAATEVVTVPVLSLRPADSPRLNGEDRGHILRLAEMDTSLPPILVDKRTMRVIDGMHRLMAASLQGRDTIDVVFFDGSEADIFLRAVQENVTHGLPLSQADRRAAAERIISTHPRMSDRAISQVAGLAAKTIATIRKRSADAAPPFNARVGIDGKVRPLDAAEGRRRAEELLTQQPDASLRDVARHAGISPATVLDVRKRLERGELAATEKPKVSKSIVAFGEGAKDATPAPHSGPRPAFRSSSASQGPAATVEKLLRDPSLRSNERGMGMLRLLHVNAVSAEHLPEVAAAVPPHCVQIVVRLARQYAKMWDDFAIEMDGQARIIDPLLPLLFALHVGTELLEAIDNLADAGDRGADLGIHPHGHRETRAAAPDLERIMRQSQLARRPLGQRHGSFSNSHCPSLDGTFRVNAPRWIPITRWIEAGSRFPDVAAGLLDRRRACFPPVPASRSPFCADLCVANG
jgi:ParB-like chromosome segregation protein Spo0J